MSVRIGFIGAGGNARGHMINVLLMPEAEIVAICDVSEEQIEAARKEVSARAAERSGSSRQLDAAAYTDVREMLRRERLDAVYISIPPFAHGEPEEAVLDAGLPFYVEKPVALDLRLALRTLARVREQGLITAVGYQLRYGSANERARELLRGRRVTMVLGARLRPRPASRPWYIRQHLSGGQLIEQATHQIDLMRWLVGEIKTVYAAADTLVHHRIEPECDIFDVNCMSLTFECGAVGNFANSVCAAYRPRETEGLHIFCEDLTVSQMGRGWRVISAAGTEEIPDEGNALERADRAFVQAVMEGRPELIRTDYENGVRTLAVTLAGEQSGRTGRPVEVRSLFEEAGVQLTEAS